MSVCLSAWNNPASTKRIYIKFDIWGFFENLSRKFNLDYNLTRITGTLHEQQIAFVTACRSVLLKTRNVSDKSCRENQTTHFMFNNVSILKSCNLRGNVVVGHANDDNILRRKRIACWMTKATDILRICNIYFIYTATTVTRTRLAVTLYAHCALFTSYQAVNKSQHRMIKNITLHPQNATKLCW